MRNPSNHFLPRQSGVFLFNSVADFDFAKSPDFIFPQQIDNTLRILTPPMETPDPPNDTPGALKHVVLTPHDIPWSLRAMLFLVASCDHHNPQTRGYLSEGPTLA